ncbi:MAG: hypothetical protein O3A32_08500 [Proteobacteria bacterium]|nr:hypothetical protein [Pseudomonadota bacterium]MDA1294777.1 hypothetical protein [Pseudomonadota bacterium]
MKDCNLIEMIESVTVNRIVTWKNSVIEIRELIFESHETGEQVRKSDKNLITAYCYKQDQLVENYYVSEVLEEYLLKDFEEPEDWFIEDAISITILE